ncbi:inositol monophosphatase family protein [Quadrisphaera granulorum]|nr:inositol monophosphatase family protein [Quadrisphaera granulorum]
MLYWRTLPWDHVPGGLLIAEAGGRAAHLDGGRYRLQERREGLLVAGSPDRWERAREELGV